MRLTTNSPIPQQVDPRHYSSWIALLHQQHSVISLDQCATFRVTPDAVAAQLQAGRWRRIFPTVYATHTGALTRPARLSAAVLYSGPHALLSHRTAAEEWKILPVCEDEPVHVTIQYGRSVVSKPPKVVLHRSRAIRHLAVASDPPRTSLAHTIIDIAAGSPTPISALESVVELAGRAPVRIGTLSECLTNRPPWRYRVAIKEGLRLASSGIASVLELRYLGEVEDAHGLPTGQRQTPVEVDGRVLWEDVTYDHAGVTLTVRLDGREFHSTPGVAFRDRRRDNVAELRGRSRLVYGWDDVTRDPCGVAAEVAGVLRRDGWSGHHERCPRCPPT